MLFLSLVLVSVAEGLLFGGNSYRLYLVPSTWKDAASVCNSAGGSLLNFKTAAEQDFIEGVLEEQNVTAVWTAGHYVNAYWQWRNRWSLKGQGCYDDDCGICFIDKHDLEFAAPTQSTMSIAFCITYCRGKGYEYCGLQLGYICYCGGNGATFGKRGPATGCNKPCLNNGDDMCGGVAKNSIYATRETAYSDWWNYHPESTSKQCAALTREHAYQWLEDSCFTQKSYICQQDIVNVSDVCRFQMLSYRFCVSISKPGETANWFQARERCSTLGPDVDLATLDEAHKQKAMKDYLAQTPGMQAKDFWIGATRNQLLWNLDGRMHNFSKVYISRFDNSSTFDKVGNLLFHATNDGYKLKDVPEDGKATAGFVCQNDLPTTTGPPTTSTVSPSTTVTSDQPLIPTTAETTPTTITTTATTKVPEASTTTEESGSGNAMGQGGGAAADDNLIIYVACGGGALFIILVIVAIVIAKKRKPSAKKRDMTFKINYAPSIQDLNRRSTNIVDGSVTIQAAEDNIYTDPAHLHGAAQGALYDNADDHKREQMTNKARMRAINEGMYDVPKPRLSEIPAAPEPIGIDDRRPAPLPAGQAIKMDVLNKGVDATKDTQPIYEVDGNPTEYSYAYGGFMGPPEPTAGNVSGGMTSYERLVN